MINFIKLPNRILSMKVKRPFYCYYSGSKTGNGGKFVILFGEDAKRYIAKLRKKEN